MARARGAKSSGPEGQGCTGSRLIFGVAAFACCNALRSLVIVGALDESSLVFLRYVFAQGGKQTMGKMCLLVLFVMLKHYILCYDFRGS